MRGRTLTTATAFALAFAVGIYAQAPDFSGTWVLDAPPAADGGGGRGGRGGGGNPFGQQFMAKQDAKTLTITRMQGDQTVVLTYNLDGSESKNTVAGRGGPQEQVSKATWEGNKLTIVTTLDFGGNAVEQRRVLSMEGGNLVIEQTQPGRGGGEPTTTKLVYKKG